ncbi:MAG: hypothetical protein U0520_04430 [Candidatus Saccharimonadales bacterium]
MEISTRDELLQSFATGLDQLILELTNDERELEPDVPPSALLDLMQVGCLNMPIYSEGEVMPSLWNASIVDRAEFAQLIRQKVANNAGLSKWGEQIFDKNGVKRPEVETVDISYTALKYGRRELIKSNDPVDKLRAVCNAAFIAGVAKPGHWADGQVPKKHKNETDEDIVFRTAISDLSYFVQLGRRREVRLLHEAYDALAAQSSENLDERFDKMMAMPGNEVLREGRILTGVSNAALDLRDYILSGEFSSTQFHEEIGNLLLFEQQRKQNTDSSSLPVVETEWEILPPEVLEKISDGSYGSEDGDRRFIDLGRLKWLASIALQWDPQRAYLAVADLDTSGEHDYVAAILPEDTDHGVIEHVVAENPVSGNAVYVFRAEKGFRAGARTVGWREVFNKTKFIARALGARKIVHNGNVQDNVLEYLTRPERDLDKQGYRR